MTTKKRTKRKTENYINNKEFTEAVSTHVRGVKDDKAAGKEPRMISDYIAICFMKISEGLSHSPNFINYSFREDMVMDAVENCIKAINNFDIDKPTRTGKPNPFSYFTQISYYAFLRRIAKEKKQLEIKQKVIDSSNTEMFANFDGDDANIGTSLIEGMRYNNETFYREENELGKPFDENEVDKKKSKKRSAKKKMNGSSLSTFLS